MKKTTPQIEIIGVELRGLKVTLMIPEAVVAPAPMPQQPSSVKQVIDAVDEEGSGLIDMRAMASAYLNNVGTSVIGSIDDLPVFDGGSGFSEPFVIVPTSGGNNKIVFALIGALGLLTMAAVVLIVVRLCM